MKALILPLGVLLLIVCMSMSCNKDSDRGRHAGDCPPDLMCTMEFRYIQITVTDSAGKPVSLDTYRTIRLADGHAFDLQHSADEWEDSTRRATGIYPLLTDSEQKQVSTRGENFEFRGEKDGVMIVQEQYQVRDDCCHIDLISGNTIITIP